MWCWAFRPEHFDLKPGEWPRVAPSTLDVMLNVIEPLGNDMDVYMSTALHDHVVGRVEARPGLDGCAGDDVLSICERSTFSSPERPG